MAVYLSDFRLLESQKELDCGEVNGCHRAGSIEYEPATHQTGYERQFFFSIVLLVITPDQVVGEWVGSGDIRQGRCD